MCQEIAAEPAVTVTASSFGGKADGGEYECDGFDMFHEVPL